MNVLINTATLDSLADTIAAKSGESTPLTLAEMIDAVDGIQTGGILQTKSKTYTPSASQQTEAVVADSGYNGLDRVNVTVNPIPSQYIVPSGNKAITANGTNIDVKQYATVSVDVTGESNIETLTQENWSATATNLTFTLKGEPKAFLLKLNAQLTRSSSYSYYYITAIRYDGSNTRGNYWRMYNGNFYNDTSHYSYAYNASTKVLTISSSAGRSSAGGSFYNGEYELVYVY